MFIVKASQSEDAYERQERCRQKANIFTATVAIVLLTFLCWMLLAGNSDSISVLDDFLENTTLIDDDESNYYKRKLEEAYRKAKEDED